MCLSGLYGEYYPGPILMSGSFVNMSACTICGKKCKNKKGLALHKRLKHSALFPETNNNEKMDSTQNFATTTELNNLKEFLCEMINSLAAQTSSVLAKLKD